MLSLTKRLALVGCGVFLKVIIGTASAEVVVVVSADNPVNTLSRVELTDIYLGRLDHFPNGEPVTPIDQSEASPAHNEFYNEYLGRSAAQIKAHWSKLIFTGRGRPPRSVDDGADLVDMIADNPNAIGYVDPGFVDDRVRIVSVE